MDRQAPPSRPGLVVVTADTELLDHILSVTAAVGLDPWVAGDPGGVRPRWAGATTVLVGVDQAAALDGLRLPQRAGVYVLGLERDRDSVHSWSTPLGAAVLTLPDGAGRLADVLADAGAGSAQPGQVVCVVGGSGGVGASTLTAGLGFVAARLGHRSMLVDADPLGGGLDLLIGAEREEGWRWPRLSAARGHLGDLGGQLPQVDGVDVLAMGRGESGTGGPDIEQLTAVLESAVRSHGLCVVDVPRALDPVGREAVRRADQVLLLVQADVRGVAAGREVARELDRWARRLSVVVRLGRARALDADTVADGLRIPLVGTVTTDPALIVAAESGDPPARAQRSPLARTCRTLLAGILDEAVAA